MSEPALLEISQAVAEIYPQGRAPRERTVREHMDQFGCIVRVGRECFTTRKLLDFYKEAMKCGGSGQNSKRFAAKRKTVQSSTRRGGSSPSGLPMALLPEDELSMALAATQQRRARPKLIA